ncbi:ABC transporter ATP-binding protein [Roseomonas marmotae]|uniref:ABC transporter ATP-binding protein n=1 Tax=Roseomonas marmotae TaxID=2768161 RepID=A0ABS3KHV5_9PROT|nr:ABC transporter ATP-binding protein [Roseomonas marmotae]MBO1077049.1 ABC transporter ATP-binding protein [Roseomonas marmotae]QTI82114.1 ABC transporter ATP-binding protein [Roseomonas marmotae]
MDKGHLQVREVGKSFGAVRALAGVSLDIQPGEFISFLGPSGCGKTTLLRLIAGFETPDVGGIALDGRPLQGLPPNHRDIGLVFQNLALFPHLSVAENIGFGLSLRRRPAAEIEREVRSALELVDLPDYGARRIQQLSGGQRQRVALARALVLRPGLLLLDEPLSALDLKLRRQLQGELKSVQRRTGTTFIFVTHDQEEALSMADRVAVFQSGQLAQVGTPQEVYQRPANRFVAEFVGEANMLGPDELARLGVSLPANRLLVVRPEEVSVGAAALERPVRLEGSIDAMDFIGPHARFRVAPHGGGPALIAVLPGSAAGNLGLGSKATLGFDPATCATVAA